MSRAPGRLWVVGFRQHAAERRDARAHHIHRMGSGRQQFKSAQDSGGKSTQRFQLGFVGAQFGNGGQGTVHEEIGNLLELTGLRDVENVVAAVVQVIAGAAHRAQRGVAGDDAG